MYAERSDWPLAGVIFERSNDAYGSASLTVAGEVDFSNAELLRARLTAILDEPHLKRLTVECAPLDFIDSLGVQTLLAARQLAGERGIGFAVANTRGKVRQVMAILGVAELLETSRTDL
jgi:anti-anti-sigma factor